MHGLEHTSLYTTHVQPCEICRFYDLGITEYNNSVDGTFSQHRVPPPPLPLSKSPSAESTGNPRTRPGYITDIRVRY